MDYLLDTDNVIDLLSNKGSGVERFEKVANEKLFLSVVSWSEVRYGIDKYHNVVERQEQFKTFLYNFGIQIIPVDIAVCEKFVEIKLDLEKRHSPLENFDLLIAATAISNNLTLVTGNLSHFKRIPGLKIL